ncbi:MAG: hypothetical protein R6U96_00355 [Promethearchaeia archaeon]
MQTLIIPWGSIHAPHAAVDVEVFQERDNPIPAIGHHLPDLGFFHLEG